MWSVETTQGPQGAWKEGGGLMGVCSDAEDQQIWLASDLGLQEFTGRP